MNYYLLGNVWIGQIG